MAQWIPTTRRGSLPVACRKNSGVAHDHRAVLEALRLGLTYDQLNLANCAMAEHICRRLIQHELAVEKDSSHPDYGGLGNVLGGTTEEKGRAAVPKFSKWVSEKQEQRARILKQDRLYREERQAETKRRKGKGKGKGDDPPPDGGK